MQNKYSTINNVVANTLYSAAIQTGGYITVRQGSYNGPVVSHGPSPHNWSSTTAGTFYIHWNTNAGCGTATNCIATSISFIASAPPTPATLVQSTETPACATGSTIESTGTPTANSEWYWQISPTGTSMANPYTGPRTIFTNGVYYLRAVSTIATVWSNATSINVTNFPVAPTPPAPIAAANPACVTGTTLSMSTPPAGIEYYWQGESTDLSTTITNSTAGGVWSSNDTAVNNNISGVTLNTAGLAGNTYDINYILVDGCASDMIVSQIKVVEPVDAGLDGNITACKNQPIDLLTGLSGEYAQGGNWYNSSMELISTGQITTTKNTGEFDYTYIVPNEVCPNDTAIVTVTVGDCDYLTIEKLAMEDVELYPNPSNGVVYIQSDFAGQFNLEITDVNGRVIQTGSHINTGTSTVNLKDVERGIYFFQLSSNNAEKVFRVVIQ